LCFLVEYHDNYKSTAFIPAGTFDSDKKWLQRKRFFLLASGKNLWYYMLGNIRG
jgi:hypothetical protein